MITTTSTTVAPSSSSSTTAAPTATTTRPYVSALYSRPSSWLCRPETDDACETELDTTVVRADGSTEVRPFEPAEDAQVDCFYVYPTVSTDEGTNSDMVPGREERSVIRQQAGRFGAVCDLYVPMYRQFSHPELERWSSGESPWGTGRAAAYADVLDAWKHYLENDNEGRGVILIGHSQGAMHLTKLLRDEIDPDEDQRELLVSAMLIGSTVHPDDVPHLDPCRRIRDVGCVVSYSSFRSTSPPPENSLFAVPSSDGERAICTNPAALAGGAGLLDPYFSGYSWGVDVSTPFATLPGLVSGECVERDGFSYLELTVHADDGPREDDIRGDLEPHWGMHAIDVNVALGDLVRVARGQAASYSAG